MDSKWSDVKDKFDSFFKFTSLALRPYLRIKYQPRETDDTVTKLTVYVGSWALVGIIYVVFVYLFFVDRPSVGFWAGVADFVNRPWREIGREVFTAFKVSVFFNSTFLVMLYFAVFFHAEKMFLHERFLHFKLSGLIKVLTLGKFDISSQVAEQDEAQVQIARTNIHKTVSDSNKELISIVSASGWDLFGTPKATTAAAPVKPKDRWWHRLKPKPKPLDNGYLLGVISQQFRKVQIVLLDPDGSGAKERANAYQGRGAHKPVTSTQDYVDGIKKVIENIKAVAKTNKNIELKLVDRLPQWKTVIVEGEAWVQPIIQGVRSDHTPLYGFNKTEYSMYHVFWHLNEAIWHDPSSKKVDLA